MKLFTQIIFFLAIPLLIFWIFKSWFFSPVIASGDFWYFFSSMLNNFSLYPYAWYSTAISSGLGGPGFANQYGIMLSALTVNIAKILNLSWETFSRLFYISFIPLSFGSSIFFIRKMFPNIRFWIFASVVFSLNTYVLMTLGGGQIPTVFSYALMPFAIYSFITLAEKSQSNKTEVAKNVVFCSFLLALQTFLDLRIAFISSIAIFIYLLIEFWSRGVKWGVKTLFLYLLSFFILGLINSFWLTSVLLFGINPIEKLGIDYSSLGIVKFLSFAKLENSIGLLHPYWPENIFGKIGFMKAEFLLLPILAFSSLLFIAKDKIINKYVLYFCLIGLVGIFLGKGASEPFGNLYIWLFQHIPGFQLFRDSFKWYTLIALSYSILIPYTVWQIYEWIKSREKFSIFNFQFSIKSKFFNFQNFFVVFVFGYLLFLLKPAILGELGGTFRERTVPSEYVDLDRFLSSDKSFYRTLWIPNTVLFGHYTNSHPQISGRDFFREYDHKKLISKLSTDVSRKLIDHSSVKYVIVPEDSEKEIYLTERVYDEKKYKFVVDSLDKIAWLEKERQFGKIIVYKTEDYKDHFWCNCSAKIDYKFINPTFYKLSIKNAKEDDKIVFAENFDKNWVAKSSGFKVQSSKFEGKFNSFTIPENGDYLITVSYELQKYVDLGVKISVFTLLVSASVLLLSLAFRHEK